MDCMACRDRRYLRTGQTLTLNQRRRLRPSDPDPSSLVVVIADPVCPVRGNATCLKSPKEGRAYTITALVLGGRRRCREFETIAVSRTPSPLPTTASILPIRASTIGSVGSPAWMMPCSTRGRLQLMRALLAIISFPDAFLVTGLDPAYLRYRSCSASTSRRGTGPGQAHRHPCPSCQYSRSCAASSPR